MVNMSASPANTSAQTHQRRALSNRGVGSGINVVRLNARWAPLSDLYHALIRMPWHLFLPMVVMVYLVANLLFALVYTALGDVIAGSTGFWDNFFFSVQTWATIGYGGMSPKTTAANIVVVVESMSGIFGVAMLTGLLFAKFSRPNARILFANHAVVTRRNGQPFLMVRMANERGSFVVEASAHITIVKPEVTAEGERMRRVFDLDLVRDNQPWFVMSWTVMHPIDEKSPFFGLTEEQLRRDSIRISVNIMGFDSTVGQTVHASASYDADSILFGYRYADTSQLLPDGRLVMDYAKFHVVEPQT